MSRNAQWIFAMLLISVPTYKLLVPVHGNLLAVPQFGKKYTKRALPEVREAVEVTSKHGYDGQFYAQIALSPALTDARLDNAVDSLPYRAQRIGLPAMAYGLGLGKPLWIVYAYSTLNLAFWLLLAAGLYKLAGFDRFQGRLLAIAVLWSAGCLISIARALTDLPAAAVGLWGLVLAETHLAAGAGVLALSALFKETSVLTFPALAWAGAKQPARRLLWLVPLLVAPVLIWQFYVRWNLGSHHFRGNFVAYPLVGWLSLLFREAGKQWDHFPKGVSTKELQYALALGVQFVYFLAKPRMRCPWWRWGVGFVLLGIIIQPIWIEHNAYLRVLLPMTVAFNVLLWRHEKGASYFWWLVLGNVCLLRGNLLLVAGWLVFEWVYQRRTALRVGMPKPHIAIPEKTAEVVQPLRR